MSEPEQPAPVPMSPVVITITKDGVAVQGEPPSAAFATATLMHVLYTVTGGGLAVEQAVKVVRDFVTGGGTDGAVG